jgi:uncharacterized membrane protein
MQDGWGRAALRCYGAAQVLLALAVVPGLSTTFADHADAGLGTAALHLAAGATALGFLALAGAHTFRAAGKQDERVHWGRSQLLALGALGAAAFALGHPAGGLLGVIAAVAGAWALSAWTSHRPGGKKAGAIAACIAALAYILGLRNHLLAGLQDPAAFGAAWAHAIIVPATVLGGLAVAAVLTVTFSQGTLRRLGLAVAAAALVIVGLQLGRRGLDLLSDAPWRDTAWASFKGAEVALACAALALSLLAAALGIAWGVRVLVREVPELMHRLGHGLGQNEPGEVCTSCGWIPIEDARYCMMCGVQLWTPEHQPPASP